MGDLFENISGFTILEEGLAQLGLASEAEQLLFFVDKRDNYKHEPSIWFQLEKAGVYESDAVFFKKGIRDDEYIPQIYIYDRTQLPFANKGKLTEIHKNVWTGGEIPLVCVFSKTEIIILDTTKPIEESRDGNFSPAYFVENLKEIAGVHKVFNENFTQRLKSGSYWDTANVDFYKNSAYSRLTELLRRVIDRFTIDSGLTKNGGIVQKLIIQCILVKYLEERRDDANNSVFPLVFSKIMEAQHNLVTC